jgi:serine/threonine-protein kinase RsbW
MRSEKIIIPATYKDIRIPAERLRVLLNNAGQTEDVINGCELALQELLTNLIDHAYGGDAGGLITVSISCAADQILIETNDNGNPAKVDLNKVEMPDPTELAEGGYGLAIIRSLMDEVNYKIKNGMNTWQLIKYF